MKNDLYFSKTEQTLVKWLISDNTLTAQTVNNRNE